MRSREEQNLLRTRLTAMLRRGEPALYVGCGVRVRPASIFAATRANTPRMTPDTTPITGPVIAIISRGEPAIGEVRIISASRAWLAIY